MEGPRAVRADEMTSLSDLVDTVFRGGPGDRMFRQYPQLFNEANLDNLLVFADGDRVVSHYGMTRRWACLGGCTVQMACAGAVATYEDYRGKGLATQLLEASATKARNDGADMAMISGGRGLYRRNGAVDYGFAAPVHVGAAEAERLHNPSLEARELTENDIDACAALYAGRSSRFIRPVDDWQWFFQSRGVMDSPCRGLAVTDRGVVCGYLMIAEPDAAGASRVPEFGGNDHTVSGALASIMRACGSKTLRFDLQEQDAPLRTALERAGCRADAPASSCTLMLLNFPQLMERLRPWFEARAGLSAARMMSFGHPEQGVFVFACGGGETRIEGRGAAASFIFRPGLEPAKPHPWNRIFPAPSLWYGLNYV